jgi:heme-degrading monooxygenase HmoA
MPARLRTGSNQSLKPRCPRDRQGYGCGVAVDPDDNGLFVVTSRIQVSAGHSDDLVAAFRERSGVVDGAEGFDHLEVWRERRDATHFVMTSWWASPDAFKAYMGSDGHRTSHARVSRGDGGPRGVGVARFDVVAR